MLAILVVHCRTVFLRDPNKVIPFLITNEHTRERYLTGKFLPHGPGMCRTLLACLPGLPTRLPAHLPASRSCTRLLLMWRPASPF